MKKPYIIGVTGPTASGKTYVVKSLRKEFKDKLLFIPQDDYYKDAGKVDIERWFRANLDTSKAFDNGLLIKDLKKLISGKAIIIPQYDFNTRRRLAKKVKLSPKPVVILEGILIFNVPELRKLMDFKVFLDAAADIRLARRLLRDITEKRVDPERLKGSISWYLSTVKPMQEKYIIPMKKYADLVLNTNEGGKKAAGILREHIMGILGT